MQRFTDLAVWQRGHALALTVYGATRVFPREELFGLTSQLRRAAVSVPSNIAEGSKRLHRPDYARFLNLAEGSLAEVESLVIFARDLAYLDRSQASGLVTECQALARMVYSLRRRVELAIVER